MSRTPPILDPRGDRSCKVPHDPTGILRLTAALLEQEDSRPEGERLQGRYIERIRTLYPLVAGGQSGRQGSETDRAAAAEAYRLGMSQATPPLREAVKVLKIRHGANLAELERWGLDTVAEGGKVKVRLPNGRTQWEGFLFSFVAEEGKRPAAERMALPSYEVIADLAAQVADARERRDAAQHGRKQGVEVRDANLDELQDLLQVAACVLVAELGGKVTTELESWGFKTAARKGSKASDGAADPPAPAEAEAGAMVA